MLRPALRSEDPTAFWVAAAPLITEMADPQHHLEELPEGVDLLDTFLEIDVAETTALLHMVAAMSPDDGLRSRAQAGLTTRRQPMPPQVSGLAQASVTEALAFSDGAGENLMVELLLPRGVRAVLITYIAWSPVPYMKDAFAIGEPMDEVTRTYREIMARDGDSLDEMLETVTLADAGARFRQALTSTPTRRRAGRDRGAVADAAVLRGIRSRPAAGRRRRATRTTSSAGSPPATRSRSTRRGSWRTAPTWSRSSSPPQLPPISNSAKTHRTWPHS